MVTFSSFWVRKFGRLLTCLNFFPDSTSISAISRSPSEKSVSRSAIALLTVLRCSLAHLVKVFFWIIFHCASSASSRSVVDISSSSSKPASLSSSFACIVLIYPPWVTHYADDLNICGDWLGRSVTRRVLSSATVPSARCSVWALNLKNSRKDSLCPMNRSTQHYNLSRLGEGAWGHGGERQTAFLSRAAYVVCYRKEQEEADDSFPSELDNHFWFDSEPQRPHCVAWEVMEVWLSHANHSALHQPHRNRPWKSKWKKFRTVDKVSQLLTDRSYRHLAFCKPTRTFSRKKERRNHKEFQLRFLQ